METQDSLFLTVNEGYNHWAEFYDQDDIPLHVLEEGIVDETLGKIRDLKIADLACGTGRQSIRLSKNGARVVGVDQSEGMLKQAKEKNLDGKVEFIHADLESRFPFPDAEFDRVVSFLALEHFTSLEHFFRESKRICKPNGSLFYTAMHPAMMLKGVQARYTEDSGRKVYPKSFPYQISNYVNAAIAVGLKLAHLTEHTPEEIHAEKSERALKYQGWPLLLTLTFLP